MQDQKPVRTFIATIPDQKTTERLVDACHRLKTQLRDQKIKWIEPQNFHLTLRFFGSLDREQLKQLSAALETKLLGYQACKIDFDRICGFPSGAKPKIIAATFRASPELQAIAVRTELAAQTIGLAPEPRPFRAHLTLARIKSRKATPMTITRPLAKLCLSVDKLILITSELTPNGAAYRRLKTFPLA